MFSFPLVSQVSASIIISFPGVNCSSLLLSAVMDLMLVASTPGSCRSGGVGLVILVQCTRFRFGRFDAD
jgi:hypothetical protein